MKEPFNTQIDSDLRVSFDKARAGLRLKVSQALDLAIRQWLHHVTGENTGTSRSESPIVSESVVIEHTHSGDEITTEEWRWVHRVLKIVRAGQPKAMAPLDTNLDAFVELSELLGGSIASTGSAVPHTQADIERAIQAVRDTEAATQRVQEKVERAIEGAPRPRKRDRGA